MTTASISQSDRKVKEAATEMELRFQVSPLLALPATPSSVSHVPIESIQVAHNGHGGEADLDGLVASIQAHGILEPLVIAPDGRLLADRRRLQAARRAGLPTVPVTVCDVVDERTAIEIGLVENVQRADLDPLSRGQSYRSLIEHGATVEEVVALVGQGIGHVYQHLALLDLHADVQHALHARTISFADARTLAPLTVDDQAAVLKEIRNSPRPLSSRQVKARVDARRLVRLSQKANSEPGAEHEPDGQPELQGNYGSLFDTDESPIQARPPQSQDQPLEELNKLIGEMVDAAQGEDSVRAWARRLSHILKRLQDEATNCGKAQAREMQGRFDL